jgi:hypothetical protein
MQFAVPGNALTLELLEAPESSVFDMVDALLPQSQTWRASTLQREQANFL